MPNKKNILLCSANPIDQHFLKLVNKESEVIYQILTNLNRHVRISPAPNLSFSKLIDTFFKTEKGNQIEFLHYCGHSSMHGIQLEDGNSGENTLSVKAFSDFLSNRAKLKIVFLNSCSSEHIGQQLIAQGSVEVVIETNKSIYDNDAVIFAEQFYRSLADGLTIRKAFKEAKNVLLNVLEEKRGQRRGVRIRGEAGDTFPWKLTPDTDDQNHLVNTWQLFEPISKELDQPNTKKLLCLFPSSVQNEDYFTAVKNTILPNNFDDLENKKIIIKKFSRLKEEVNWAALINKFDSFLFFISDEFNTFWEENKQYFEQVLPQKRIGLLLCNCTIEEREKNYDLAYLNPIDIPHIGGFSLDFFCKGNSKQVVLTNTFKEQLKQILIPKDKIDTQIIQSTLITGFKDFNFEKQRVIFENPSATAFSKFNLFLLEGTSFCGHELFIKRILDFANPIIRLEESKFSYVTISKEFKQEYAITASDIWSILADYILEDRRLGRSPDEAEITEKLLLILNTQNLIIIFNDIQSNEKAIIALITFWKVFLEKSSDTQENANRLLIFALNKGLSDSCTYQDKQFEFSDNHLVMKMQPIEQVNEGIFNKWYNGALLQDTLKGDQRYLDMQTKRAEMLEEPLIGKVIGKICAQMDCKEIQEDVLTIGSRT